METRGLIDETLRINPEYDGLPEALYILRQSNPGRTSGADGDAWQYLRMPAKLKQGRSPAFSPWMTRQPHFAPAYLL